MPDGLHHGRGRVDPEEVLHGVDHRVDDGGLDPVPDSGHRGLMAFLIPLIKEPPRDTNEWTVAAPHAPIWPGSRENQPDRLVQARPRALEMVPTTLDHHRATVELTDEAMPPMKLAMSLNTARTVRWIAPTVLVMKVRIWVQYRMTSTTARPTG